MELITAPRVLLAGELVGPGWVGVEEGRIVTSGQGSSPDRPATRLPRGVLAPGLVDLQINGAFGHDLADADLPSWCEVAIRLVTTGVTSFVPTIITAPIDDLVSSIDRYRRLRAAIDDAGGARTLGLHCEGPFLAPGRHGAHDEHCLVDPTPARLAALLDAGADVLAYVTLAPERDGALTAIRTLVDAGIGVAVGHSDARDDQVRAAADAGARLVTHLYNAQRPLHHRDPGVVGAALTDGRLTAGLIADLHHVAPTAIQLAFTAAPGRIALVSDAIAALGMPAGTYDLGGQTTTVRESAPPERDDGTLAGSVLRLDDAIANTISCGVDGATALTAATRVPADVLGRLDAGRLTPGATADLVWLDDDWRAAATWVGGRLVHRDPDRASEVLAPPAQAEEPS